MKHILKTFFIQQRVSLLVLSALGLIIWFGTPWLVINNNVPFESIGKRIYLIILLFSAWLLKIIFFDTTSDSQSKKPTLKKTHALQARFEGAIQFLKKTRIVKQGNNISLSQLPWYFLIGPPSAGKTTLLTNSTVHFLLSKQHLAEHAASDTCDWWATRDAVIVDVPGTYILHQTSLHTTLWNNLLNLTKKYRKNVGLGGVIITLSFPEILKQSSIIIAQHIKERLHEIRIQFGAHIPIYLLITQCDLIPGFMEFFGDSSMDELAQGWGITIPKLKDTEKLHEAFSYRFNALIKRLNKQLIWRLHQERNPQARPFIKDFPLQIERLKDTIAHYIKILNLPGLRLQGVYLTSATQETHHEQQVLLEPDSHSIQLTIPKMPVRAYFIKQFILQSLPHVIDWRPAIMQPKEYWQRRIIYGSSITLALTAAIFLINDFQHGIKKTYAIQNDLSHYQASIQQTEPSNDQLKKSLSLLNGLQEAAENSNSHLSRLIHFLSFYSNKSQQTAVTIYRQALQTVLLPALKNDIEKYLQTANDKNVEQMYIVLKAYLMLGSAENVDVEYIKDTIKQRIAPTLNTQTLNALNNHIDIAFNDSLWQPANLNMELIAAVRKQLLNLPVLEISGIILKNMNNNSQENVISLGTNSDDLSVFQSKIIANQIPNMFTADAFPTVINQDIPTAVAEATQGNWILGKRRVALPSQNFAEQLHNQYITNYIDVWESLLANVQLVTPKNLAETDALIFGITCSHSPLLELLHTIKRNTALEPIMAASPKLQTLNVLLTNTNNPENTLYKIFLALRNLHSNLQAILTSTNSNRAAFETAALRMQSKLTQDPISGLRNIANQSNEPLKTWLTHIADQSWDFMLDDASHFIELTWETDILSIYNDQIANHYPFTGNAPVDVALPQFVSFFGAQGLLNNFYNTYIKPFIDDSGTHWRIVDSQRIPLSEVILRQVVQAQKFQHVFFPNNDNQLSVQFSLQPIKLDNATKVFDLNINGQIIAATNREQSPHFMTWPGNSNQHQTIFYFTTHNNQVTKNAIAGDWGWFRLVSKVTGKVNNRKEIELNFAANGHTAKYLLITNNPANPFLPSSLEGFYLPQELVENQRE